MPRSSSKLLKNLYSLVESTQKKSKLDHWDLVSSVTLTLKDTQTIKGNELFLIAEKLALSLTDIYHLFLKSGNIDVEATLSQLKKLSMYESSTFIQCINEQNKNCKTTIDYLLVLENFRSGLEHCFLEKWPKQANFLNVGEDRLDRERLSLSKELVRFFYELEISCFHDCASERNKLAQISFKKAKQNAEEYQIPFDVDLISANIAGLASRTFAASIAEFREIKPLIDEHLRCGSIYSHRFIFDWITEEGQHYPDFLRWMAVVENYRIVTLIYMDDQLKKHM
ncbi:hypothetical protein [Kiloniella sp.]|uniref:hypothetical protein n=1 Tax=Kiloniella sp. TaxID=1938587 RepID=UPI003A8F51F0